MNPLYELVPISEKPEKDGPVTIYDESNTGHLGKYENGLFFLYVFAINDYIKIIGPARWLREITAETLKARIREELENCWDESRIYSELHGEDEEERKQAHINSVIDKLFKQ